MESAGRGPTILATIPEPWRWHPQVLCDYYVTTLLIVALLDKTLQLGVLEKHDGLSISYMPILDHR